MKTNIGERTLQFFPNDTPSTFTVNAGAAGWIDTDVSAETGLVTNKLWLVLCYTQAAGGDTTGVRKHGETLEPLIFSKQTAMALTYVDASGHVDFYRVAAVNNQYMFIGYLQ